MTRNDIAITDSCYGDKAKTNKIDDWRALSNFRWLKGWVSRALNYERFLGKKWNRASGFYGMETVDALAMALDRGKPTAKEASLLEIIGYLYPEYPKLRGAAAVW